MPVETAVDALDEVDPRAFDDDPATLIFAPGFDTFTDCVKQICEKFEGETADEMLVRSERAESVTSDEAFNVISNIGKIKGQEYNRFRKFILSNGDIKRVEERCTTPDGVWDSWEVDGQLVILQAYAAAGEIFVLVSQSRI